MMDKKEEILSKLKEMYKDNLEVSEVLKSIEIRTDKQVINEKRG